MRYRSALTEIFPRLIYNRMLVKNTKVLGYNDPSNIRKELKTSIGKKN